MPCYMDFHLKRPGWSTVDQKSSMRTYVKFDVISSPIYWYKKFQNTWSQMLLIRPNWLIKRRALKQFTLAKAIHPLRCFRTKFSWTTVFSEKEFKVKLTYLLSYFFFDNCFVSLSSFWIELILYFFLISVSI